MRTPPGERVGVLVVRVWIEAPAEQTGFRARVTRADDLASGEQTSVVAASPEDVVAIVCGFLADFLASDDAVTER